MRRQSHHREIYKESQSPMTRKRHRSPLVLCRGEFVEDVIICPSCKHTFFAFVILPLGTYPMEYLKHAQNVISRKQVFEALFVRAEV